MGGESWRALTRFALLLLAGTSMAAAGTTQSYWHDQANRALWPDAPHPATYRAVALDRAPMTAYLKAAHVGGGGAEVDLPLPEGGFARFQVVDSGTMPAALQAKYPDILSFKGRDAKGRRLRLDVSPLGFQAMVFDPDGIWVVRPETLASGTSQYLSFRRDQLDLPSLERYREGPITGDATQSASKPAAVTTTTGAQKRVYRVAVAANHQYIAAVGGGTAAGGLAAVVTAVNRVTEIYEYELSIQLVLVPNDDLIMYPNPNSDPFAGNNGNVINNSTSIISNAIGAGNYDIGHVFTTGSGGIAGLGVVCKAARKGSGTTGLPNPIGDAFYVDFVAHEMGHQFGGNHPFNGALVNCSGGNRNGATAYEPGSGTTIMSYAGICGADDLQPHSDPYFHAISLQEITNYTNGAGNCSVNTANANQPPVIDASSLPPAGLTIPAQTPFRLSASATDPDAGDSVLYSWEEWDLGAQAPLSAGDNGHSPIFRAFEPVASGTRVFPSMSTVLGGAAIKGETLPTTTRTLNFRLTARDHHVGSGGVPGNGTSASIDYALNVVNTGTPFKVTSPVAGSYWSSGGSGLVAWDVAGTDVAPISCANVDIWFSTDAGASFSTVATVPNNGSASIAVPNVATGSARVGVACSSNVFFNVSPGAFTVTSGAIYSVGGSVTGLVGSGLVLQLNGGNAMPVAADGSFTFSGGIPDGSSYSVTVLAQPAQPAQQCTVSNGSGTIQGGNISSVTVTCVTLPTYSVSGAISGLTGSGLELSLNGGAPLAVTGASYMFPDELLDGASYHVVITALPAGQTCYVANADGTVAGADVVDANVVCEAVVSDRIFANGFEDGEGQTCVPAQLFQDTSFEATVNYSNPWWQATDSVGSSPLCDASCDGGQTTARTGNWFVWMGGWSQASQSSVGQTVSLPAGHARWINYWLVNGVANDSTASLVLKIDGNIVTTVTPGNDDSWVSRSVAVPSQYLDGQAHEITFDFAASSPNGEVAGALLDDVTLECQALSARPSEPLSSAGLLLRKVAH
ncbi:MAG TPA: zinc-dependent metalloprotease family protein [Rhodanobacteraceae bacterium]|nr:zinc-dependent metalloprotease family protein [Rhodanobacteraceae bacterium]